MKKYLILFFVQLFSVIALGQLTLNNLKSYVPMSPSKLDEVLTARGFIFDKSEKNKDNDGKEYSWNGTIRPATLKWVWIKGDTVPLVEENTNKHLGYTNMATRGVLYTTYSADLYNSSLAQLSNDKAFKREENSKSGYISVGFESKYWWITLYKARNETSNKMTYTIIVKERYAVAYQLNYSDESTQKVKGIDLGE